MTQSTDTDTNINDLKIAIESIAATTEANIKAIAGLTNSISELQQEMRLGFSQLERKMNIMDTRLAEVERKLDRQETKLWTLAGIILSAAFAGLWKLSG